MTEDTQKPAELSEEAKEARRAYQRKWRREHPDAVRRYHKTYWERRAARNDD